MIESLQDCARFVAVRSALLMMPSMYNRKHSSLRHRSHHHWDLHYYYYFKVGEPLKITSVNTDQSIHPYRAFISRTLVGFLTFTYISERLSLRLTQLSQNHSLFRSRNSVLDDSLVFPCFLFPVFPVPSYLHSSACTLCATFHHVNCV